MSISVGVDPGASGAVAFVDVDSLALLLVEDIPVDKVQSGKNVRKRVARGRMLELMRRAAGAHAFAERPEGRPMRYTDRKTGKTEVRQPGAAGMLSLGENYGCCVMACTAAGMSLTEVRPGVWKSKVSVSANKDEARRRAAELWPTFADRFARKMDDGRAEASLLAYYGALTLKGRFHADVATDAA